MLSGLSMPGKLVICRKCGSLEHATEDCNPDNVRCSKCNTVGHHAKDCAHRDTLKYLEPVRVRGYDPTDHTHNPEGHKRKHEDTDDPPAKKQRVAPAPRWKARGEDERGPGGPSFEEWSHSRTGNGSGKGGGKGGKGGGGKSGKGSFGYGQEGGARPNRGRARNPEPRDREANLPPGRPDYGLPPSTGAGYNPFDDDSDEEGAWGQRAPPTGGIHGNWRDRPEERSPSPSARASPDRDRDPDQFGRTVGRDRTPSPDLQDLPWGERMDRLMEKYAKQQDARDRHRAKYGDLTPSPSPPRRLQLSESPDRPRPAKRRPAARAAAPRGDLFWEDSKGFGDAAASPKGAGGGEEDEAEAALEARLRMLAEEEEHDDE